MKKLKSNDKKPAPGPVKADPINRRDFFNKAWKGLGILAGIEVIAMLGGFMFSGKPKNNQENKQLLEAGPVDSFAANSVSAFMGGRFFLARQSDGGFIALSLRCTHLGCSIAWEEDKKGLSARVIPRHSISAAKCLIRLRPGHSTITR